MARPKGFPLGIYQAGIDLETAISSGELDGSFSFMCTGPDCSIKKISAIATRYVIALNLGRCDLARFIYRSAFALTSLPDCPTQRRSLLAQSTPIPSLC